MMSGQENTSEIKQGGDGVDFNAARQASRSDKQLTRGNGLGGHMDAMEGRQSFKK